MPLDFPTSPSPGDIYTFGGRSWQWNGSAWDVYATVANAVTFLNGFTGSVTISGGTAIGISSASNNIVVSYTGSGVGGTSYAFYQGATAPTTFSVGDRWFDSDEGKLFTAINDGATAIWVEFAGPPGPQGPDGNPFPIIWFMGA